MEELTISMNMDVEFLKGSRNDSIYGTWFSFMMRQFESENLGLSMTKQG